MGATLLGRDAAPCSGGLPGSESRIGLCGSGLFLLLPLRLDAVDGAAADAEAGIGQFLDRDHEKLAGNAGGFGGDVGDALDERAFLGVGERTALDGDVGHGGTIDA